MGGKKSIMLYLDSCEQWDMLSNEQAGILIKALLRYSKTGEQLETEDGMLRMAFSFLTAQIDRDGEKWEKKCERNAEYYQKRQKAFSDNSENSVQFRQFSTIQTIKKNSDRDTDKDTDKDINNNNKKEKEKAPTALDVMFSEYTENAELISALVDYAKFRKAIKAPLTDRALKICLNKLDALADTDERKIKVIEQSIERGWKGLFPLKEEPEPEQNQGEADKGGFDVSKYEQFINVF